MDKIKNWAIGIFALSTLVLGLLYFTKKDPAIIKVPIKIEVPVPGKVVTFPPVELPKPKKERPRPITDIPDKDKDSILKDALTERDYEQTFENGDLRATVRSKVRGYLLSQSLDAYIKPDTVSLDTVVPIEIPKFIRPELLGEIEMGYPTKVEMDPVIKAGLHYRTKKKMGYKLSYDTNGYVWGGVSIKF